MARSKSTGDVNPRKRTARSFPAASFEEALEFAKELFVVGSGQSVRRLTLFDHLGKAPDSGPSRMLITNSNKYGLTKGSYVAEQLELTADGRKAVDDGVAKREQAQVRAKLAILDIEPFRQLYERFAPQFSLISTILIFVMNITMVFNDIFKALRPLRSRA